MTSKNVKKYLVLKKEILKNLKCIIFLRSDFIVVFLVGYFLSGVKHWPGLLFNFIPVFIAGKIVIPFTNKMWLVA